MLKKCQEFWCGWNAEGEGRVKWQKDESIKQQTISVWHGIPVSVVFTLWTSRSWTSVCTSQAPKDSNKVGLQCSPGMCIWNISGASDARCPQMKSWEMPCVCNRKPKGVINMQCRGWNKLRSLIIHCQEALALDQARGFNDNYKELYLFH